MHESIMYGLWKVTSTKSLKLLNILSGLMSICKVQSLSDICRFLRWMISVRNDCESKCKTFSPYFVWNVVNDWVDSALRLCKLADHRSSCVDAKADIDESESWKWQMISGFCIERCFLKAMCICHWGWNRLQGWKTNSWASEAKRDWRPCFSCWANWNCCFLCCLLCYWFYLFNWLFRDTSLLFAWRSFRPARNYCVSLLNGFCHWSSSCCALLFGLF